MIKKNDSAIDNFGSYVARTIHAMDQSTATITRKLINDVLFEAEMGNLNSSSKVIATTPQQTVPLPIPSNSSVYSCSTNDSSNTYDSDMHHYFALIAHAPHFTLFLPTLK